MRAWPCSHSMWPRLVRQPRHVHCFSGGHDHLPSVPNAAVSAGPPFVFRMAMQFLFMKFPSPSFSPPPSLDPPPRRKEVQLSQGWSTYLAPESRLSGHLCSRARATAWHSWRTSSSCAPPPLCPWGSLGEEPKGGLGTRPFSAPHFPVSISSIAAPGVSLFFLSGRHFLL